MDKELRIKIVSKGGQMPEYATAGSAGADLRAYLEEPVTLMPGERRLFPTGLFVELPSGVEAQIRARRRARAALRDIAMCSDFRYFVTLTLDKDMVDRYDPVTVVKKLQTWLDNAVRRQGLAYVLVPEHHADGAIHFHGLFNDALPVVDSGTLSIPGAKQPRRVRSQKQRAELIAAGAHIVWNLPRWKLGFSTAIELYGERGRAVNYVCKYIGKEQQKIGGRWYYSGGALRRPEVQYFEADFSWDEMDEAHQFVVPEIGARFALLLVPAQQQRAD